MVSSIWVGWDPGSFRSQSALCASPLRSRPWPAAICQACWPKAAEPQPPASSAASPEHPASAATSSYAGRRQPVGVGVGEEHNQPFRSSPGSAWGRAWGAGGLSPSSCAREGLTKGRFCSRMLVPSWKLHIKKHKLVRFFSKPPVGRCHAASCYFQGWMAGSTAGGLMPVPSSMASELPSSD